MKLLHKLLTCTFIGVMSIGTLYAEDVVTGETNISQEERIIDTTIEKMVTDENSEVEEEEKVDSVFDEEVSEDERATLSFDEDISEEERAIMSDIMLTLDKEDAKMLF